jgi:hypothetical protein
MAAKRGPREANGGRVALMRVDWVLLDGEAQAELEVGDLVSVEAGGLPFYRVIRVDSGRAWLRDDERGFDCIAPVCLFHWKAHILPY